MKHVLIAMPLFISTPSMASPTFYDEPDKVLHTKWSAIGAHALHGIGMTPSKAFWTMLGIGAIKEMFDDNTMSEHGNDLLADAAGASTVFVWSIEF